MQDETFNEIKNATVIVEESKLDLTTEGIYEEQTVTINEKVVTV